MSDPVRDFTPKPAKRGERILQIGLMGPPGGGKTWSALELATGMQRVRGGDIILIETEGGRSLNLADNFTFSRVSIEPPFNPLAFRDAILFQEQFKPAAIIIDSMSDEHEGEGGVLERHDEYLDRKVQNEWERDAHGQRAWGYAKEPRRKFINAMYRIATPLIYCFRAREKVKPVKNEKGKTVPTNVGYQPIAPIEIVHSLDLTCLLPANARGVPEWHSEKVGEDFFLKLPAYLHPYITEGKRIDADLGEAFAKWMKGDASTPLARAKSHATSKESFREYFKTLPKADRDALKPNMAELERLCATADAPTPAAAPDPSPAPAPAAGASPGVSYALTVDRINQCTTAAGVDVALAAAAHLPPDQLAEVQRHAAAHREFL